MGWYEKGVICESPNLRHWGGGGMRAINTMIAFGTMKSFWETKIDGDQMEKKSGLTVTKLIHAYTHKWAEERKEYKIACKNFVKRTVAATAAAAAAITHLATQ